MTINAKEDLAMILPIPVKKGVAEDDLKFISLKDYPDFFTDMEDGFPQSRVLFGLTKSAESAAARAEPPLVVHDVGDFEASFVPTIKDFSRLDERFRLPENSWEKLPQYQSYGFAVFKLKPGTKTIHPMAFSFSPAEPKKLFFPTVHIHDGKVHQKAAFDHALFAQHDPTGHLDFRGWQESQSSADSFIKAGKTQGIVLKNEHCYKKELKGNLANQDTWLNRLG